MRKLGWVGWRHQPEKALHHRGGHVKGPELCTAAPSPHYYFIHADTSRSVRMEYVLMEASVLLMESHRLAPEESADIS